jgi:hypothetical protein
MNSEKGKSLFVKTVNAMMGQQEMSHQQVLSYWISGRDHYKMNLFKIIKWGEIDQYIHNELKEDTWINSHKGNGCLPQAPEIKAGAYPVGSENFIERHNEQCMTQSNQCDNNDVPLMDEHNEDDNFNTVDANEIMLQVDNEDIVPAHIMLDYCHRSWHKSFKSLTLWEHAEWVFKITKKSEAN